MAIKTCYGEELFFCDDSAALNDALEQCIRMLLTQNHGVGIAGGCYTPQMPFTLISKLTLDLLGYADIEQLHRACGGSVLPLFVPDSAGVMTAEAFQELPPISEKRLFKKGGKPIWVRVVKWDAPNVNGGPMWLMSLCDIDAVHSREEQLVLAKEAAERADQAKTRFLSRMSHDIRTPINGMLGMAHIALDNLDDPARVADALQKILTAGGQLKLLIDEVLDMSQLESGHIQLLQEAFDLHEALDKIDAVLATLAEERRVRYPQAHYLERHRHVRGSMLHITRVLENVLTNAVKYTPAGGSVERWLEEAPIDDTHSMFHFTVQDTGVGMTPEFQQHMFEPFTRAADDTMPGAGLGLAITHDLVEKMHGTIRVKSAPGAGTRVTVSLPLELTAAPSRPVTTDAAQQDLHGLRVLLAEDNSLNREIIEYLLQQAGASVESVQTGTQAVAAFAASPSGYFGAILMDVLMPELSGLDATRAIRRSGHPQAAAIPIIAVTANAFASDVQAALDAGMNEHIAKPLDAARLYTILRRCCPRKEP